MEKGLRQGDSISSYLFIIVTAALNYFLIFACNISLISGAAVGVDAVQLSATRNYKKK